MELTFDILLLMRCIFDPALFSPWICSLLWFSGGLSSWPLSMLGTSLSLPLEFLPDETEEPKTDLPDSSITDSSFYIFKGGSMLFLLSSTLLSSILRLLLLLLIDLLESFLSSLWLMLLSSYSSTDILRSTSIFLRELLRDLDSEASPETTSLASKCCSSTLIDFRGLAGGAFSSSICELFIGVSN